MPELQGSTNKDLVSYILQLEETLGRANEKLLMIKEFYE